jgi:hypothetical protein
MSWRVILMLFAWPSKYRNPARLSLTASSECVHFPQGRPAHDVYRLSHVISSAWETLIVKGQDKHLAEARLLVFVCARMVLANGMRLLSLNPLERMWPAIYHIYISSLVGYCGHLFWFELRRQNMVLLEILHTVN